MPRSIPTSAAESLDAALAEIQESLATTSVVLVSPSGKYPRGMGNVDARMVGDLLDVQFDDEVAVLYGTGMGAAVAELFALMGRRMPPVLVLSPVVDMDDVRAAFDHGATSYFFEGEYAGCLAEVVRLTAHGMSCLAPQAASVLFRLVRQAADQPYAEELPAPADLSDRERQIMQLLVAGYSPVEVAGRLLLSEKTVRNRLSQIYAKLQVRRQSEAVLLWLGHRLRRRSPDGTANRLDGT